MAEEDLKTGLDLLKAALLDAGESNSATGDYATDAKRHLRDAYWSLLAFARWPWAMSPTPGVMTTTATQRVTCLLTVSDMVQLGANITPSVAGMKFYLESNQSVYRIVSHTSGLSLLHLDATYVETETTGPAVIFQDEYALPADVLRIWDPLTPRGWQDTQIPLLDKKLFEDRYGRGAYAYGSGIFEAACEVHPQGFDASSTNMLRQIRLAPWCEDAVNIEFDYTKFHTLDFSGSGEADTPRIPLEHRSILAKLTASMLLVNKDDAKSQAFAQMADGKLKAMMDLYLPSQSGQLYVKPKHSVALGCT